MGVQSHLSLWHWIQACALTSSFRFGFRQALEFMHGHGLVHGDLKPGKPTPVSGNAHGQQLGSASNSDLQAGRLHKPALKHACIACALGVFICARWHDPTQAGMITQGLHGVHACLDQSGSCGLQPLAIRMSCQRTSSQADPQSTRLLSPCTSARSCPISSFSTSSCLISSYLSSRPPLNTTLWTLGVLIGLTQVRTVCNSPFRSSCMHTVCLRLLVGLMMLG